MRSFRRLPVAIAVSAFVVALPACSLGARTRDARAITQAAVRTLELESAAGRLHTTFELTERPDNLELSFDPEASRIDVLLPFQFDLSRRRAQVTLPTIMIDRLAEFAELAEGEEVAGTPPPPADAAAGASEESPGLSPVLLFDGTTTYARRVTSTQIDTRRWQVLDYASLESVEAASTVREFGERRGGVELLNPTVLIELLVGVLPGSVERRGTETLGGTETNRFAFNLSFDKAETELDLDEDAIDTRDKFRTLLALAGDVHAAEVWIGPDGVIRKAVVTLEQAPRRKFRFETRYTLELVALGPPAPGTRLPALDPPAREDTVRTESIAALLGTQQAVTAIGALLGGTADETGSNRTGGVAPAATTVAADTEAS